MAGPGSAERRLDKLTEIIAADMVAEVCSIYVRRPGDVLELFATKGLKPTAVHVTRLSVGEGLIGEIAARARPFALADAQEHPSFAYRPETGEEIYFSLMGVPILRGGRVIGVLAVQNRTRRQYQEEEVETLQTVAMVLAELVAGAVEEVAGVRPEFNTAGGTSDARFIKDHCPVVEFGMNHPGEIRTLVGGIGRDRLLEEYEKIVFAHTGDTMPLGPDVFRDADLVVHDATFLVEEDRRGRIHATTGEAIATARDAGVRTLVLHHLSVRYDRDQAIPALRQQVADLGYTGRCWLLDGRSFIRLSAQD